MVRLKRAIVYGPDQLYWRCYDTVYAEGDFVSKSFTLQLGRKHDDDKREHRCLLEQWYRMVELFETKGLDFPEDRLAALISLAQQVFARPGAPYMKGI
jgi:hypothetical protein